MLLRNVGGLLPLDPYRIRRVALIGPGVARFAIMGGGSARVRPARLYSWFWCRRPSGEGMQPED